MSNIIQDAANDPTPKEVAAMMDTSISTVRRLIRRGELQVWSYTDGKYSRKKVILASVEEYLRRRRLKEKTNSYYKVLFFDLRLVRFCFICLFFPFNPIHGQTH